MFGVSEGGIYRGTARLGCPGDRKHILEPRNTCRSSGSLWVLCTHMPSSGASNIIMGVARGQPNFTCTIGVSSEENKRARGVSQRPQTNITANWIFYIVCMWLDMSSSPFLASPNMDWGIGSRPIYLQCDVRKEETTLFEGRGFNCSVPGASAGPSRTH